MKGAIHMLTMNDWELFLNNEECMNAFLQKVDEVNEAQESFSKNRGRHHKGKRLPTYYKKRNHRTRYMQKVKKTTGLDPSALWTIYKLELISRNDAGDSGNKSGAIRLRRAKADVPTSKVMKQYKRRSNRKIRHTSNINMKGRSCFRLDKIGFDLWRDH